MSFDKEKLITCLEEVAKQEGFQEHAIEFVDSDSQCGGFTSNIMQMKIVNKNESKRKNDLHVIAKVAPNVDFVRNQISASSLFKREIYLYGTLFPFLELFEKQRSVTPSKFIPTLYRTEILEKAETLIIENLSINGFKIHEGNIPMNKSHLNLVFETYGRLHALSFAIKDQNPKYFNEHVNTMDDVYINVIRSGHFDDTIIGNYENAIELIASTLSSNILTIFKRIAKEIPNIIYELMPSTDDYSVILHGDCWMNNMMFKYQEDSGNDNPTDVRLLDFQLSRIGSPVLDLSYFFYSASSTESLNELEYYLNVYYNSFSTHLQKLGSCPEKLFPYSALKEHWTKFARYGLIMVPTVMNILFTKTEESVDVTKISQEGQLLKDALIPSLFDSDSYKMRIKAIVNHFVENELI